MSACDFCHGLPVQDAAEWSDGKPQVAVACPRCGEISTGGNVSEGEHSNIRRMEDRWWIHVCPGCNGLVWGGTETHNETCTYRSKIYAPKAIEVVPAREGLIEG